MYIFFCTLLLAFLPQKYAQTCPTLTFGPSGMGGVLAQGCQTPTDPSGTKTITCDDGPTSTSAILSFTYDDGTGDGPQTGSLFELGTPITLTVQCQGGQWVIQNFGGTFVLVSTTISCETTCTTCPGYTPCTCPQPDQSCTTTAAVTSTTTTTTPTITTTGPPTTTGMTTTSSLICCPVGGIWGQWTSVGTCSSTCGACSLISMTRQCLSTAYGCPCSGYSSQLAPCNTNVCFYPSNSCCTGYSAMGANGTIFCAPQTPLFDPTPIVTGCMPTGCCPPQGVWSQWSSWSTCNGTCGGCGLTTRRRICMTEANGCLCTGLATQSNICAFSICGYPNTACCGTLQPVQDSSGNLSCGPQPVVPPNVIPGPLTCTPIPCTPGGTWSTWISSSCSDVCGLCGTGVYTRTCLTGLSCPCSGSSNKTDVCGSPICSFPRSTCCTGSSRQPQNGTFVCVPTTTTFLPSSTTTVATGVLADIPACTWSDWGSYQCNDTCGLCGTFVRTRSCPNGCTCSGSSSDTNGTRCGTSLCQFPRSTCCTGASLATMPDHTFACSLTSTGRRKRNNFFNLP